MLRSIHQDVMLGLPDDHAERKSIPIVTGLTQEQIEMRERAALAFELDRRAALELARDVIQRPGKGLTNRKRREVYREIIKALYDARDSTPGRMVDDNFSTTVDALD